MYLYSEILVSLVCIVVMFVGEQGVVVRGGEIAPEIEPLNTTQQKETRPYEKNWVIMEQPRCCSDCTYVAAGFKCKVKSCLHNCPWARSAASPTTLPMFWDTSQHKVAWRRSLNQAHQSRVYSKAIYKWEWGVCALVGRILAAHGPRSFRRALRLSWSSSFVSLKSNHWLIYKMYSNYMQNKCLRIMMFFHYIR